jgi:two-component system KDP operon response regulator KdpE
MARQPSIVWIRAHQPSPAAYAAFKGECFVVLPATPDSAARQVVELRPAAVVLDDSPFTDDTVALCRRISGLTLAPVIVLSETGDEDAMVRAYTAGAADYLVQPQPQKELTARLRAVLRQNGAVHTEEDDERIDIGDLAVIPAEGQALLRGEPLKLTATEFNLLLALARARGRPVDHRTLLATVWGPEYIECRHYLRLYIRYLREKIEADPQKPRLILNEWGVGYFLAGEMRAAA